MDENGKAVATLSTSDLKGITQDSLSSLDQNVVAFVGASHPVAIAPGTFLLLTADTTMGEAALAATVAHVHQVWVVDKDKVVGAVALSDILRSLVNLEED